MIQVKCIEKLRGRRNNIYGYRIVDSSGQIRDIGAERLKEYIMEGKINVVNLKLTSNNRLVDCNEKQLINTDILGKDPKITKVEKTETKKNACDAESYSEFSELLIEQMIKSLHMEDKKHICDVKLHSNGDAEMVRGKIGPFTYKEKQVSLVLGVVIDWDQDCGCLVWGVMETNGSESPLYGEYCPLSIKDMKADFNKALKISQKVTLNIKGEIKYNIRGEVI